jgi:D-cysteine desulfhydrase
MALRTAGLVLDPVYTAKALGALPRVVGTAPAVFWHTGGLLDAVAGLLEQAR